MTKSKLKKKWIHVTTTDTHIQRGSNSLCNQHNKRSCQVCAKGPEDCRQERRSTPRAVERTHCMQTFPVLRHSQRTDRSADVQTVGPIRHSVQSTPDLNNFETISELLAKQFRKNPSFEQREFHRKSTAWKISRSLQNQKFTHSHSSVWGETAHFPEIHCG